MAAASRRTKIYLAAEEAQASSTENYNEAFVEEMKQHVPGQDSVSDGADNTLNIPVDVVEDTKQTHPHHEEEISDDDVVISDQDYTLTLTHP